MCFGGSFCSDNISNKKKCWLYQFKVVHYCLCCFPLYRFINCEACRFTYLSVSDQIHCAVIAMLQIGILIIYYICHVNNSMLPKSNLYCTGCRMVSFTNLWTLPIKGSIQLLFNLKLKLFFPKLSLLSWIVRMQCHI